MAVAYLASRETQVQARYLAALITIPTIGLICLIIGLRKRSRGRPQTSPYSLRYPTAAHFQATRTVSPPRDRPLRRAGKSANALITIGIVLLALSGLEILGNFAHVASRHAEGSGHVNAFTTDTSNGGRINEMTYIGKVFKARLLRGESRALAVIDRR